MNHIEVTHPHPACILPISHPARAYVNSDKTDIKRTFAMYAPAYGDDYDMTTRLDWLDKGFKQ